MSGWQKVKDVKAFLADKGRKSVGTHNPGKRKCLPWPVCKRCGLVYLKNDVTAKAIRSSCVIWE